MITESLNVFCNGKLAGKLAGNAKTIMFKYSDEWLEKGFPLSFAMPFSQREYGDEETRAFFCNLMPEDRILHILCKAGKIPSQNPIAFLDKFGSECAGALVITKLEKPPLKTDDADKDITPAIRKFLAENMGGSIQMAVKTRMSLGGAQDKIAVVCKGKRFFSSSGPSSHILKPDNRDYPFVARNEHFCECLAAVLGSDVVKSELVVFPERDILVVKRYDREIASDGKILRLHQQDFCQALGLLPDFKYQGQGVFFGFPNMLEICESNNVPVKDFFARAQILNYLIGNCDAHAKNFSIVRKNGNYFLAPLYDLVCTDIYPGLDKNMAMLFGKNIDIDSVSADDFPVAAEACGLSLGKYADIAESMSAKCLAALPGLVSGHREKYGQCAVYEKLAARISKAATKMLDMSKTAKKMSANCGISPICFIQK